MTRRCQPPSGLAMAAEGFQRSILTCAIVADASQDHEEAFSRAEKKKKKEEALAFSITCACFIYKRANVYAVQGLAIQTAFLSLFSGIESPSLRDKTFLCEWLSFSGSCRRDLE